MTLSCPHCSAANRDTAQFCAKCSEPLRQICASCGADNPSRSRFCNKCGKSLVSEPHCPQCGRVNPMGSLFCNSCGTALSAVAQPPAAEQPLPSQPTPIPFTVTGFLPPQTMLAGRPAKLLEQLLRLVSWLDVEVFAKRVLHVAVRLQSPLALPSLRLIHHQRPCNALAMRFDRENPLAAADRLTEAAKVSVARS